MFLKVLSVGWCRAEPTGRCLSGAEIPSNEVKHWGLSDAELRRLSGLGFFGERPL